MHIAQGAPFPNLLRRGFPQLIAHPFERRLTCGWALCPRLHASSPSSPSRVIFSGIQPTGIPHLGNYVGALQQWVKIQDSATSATDLLFSIVDLHAMTLPYDQARLRLQKRQTLAALLAVGLDPQRSTIFFQSAVRLDAASFQGFKLKELLGASTHGTHVDIKLHGVCRISLADDTVEGLFYIPLVACMLISCHLTKYRFRSRAN